MAVVSRHSVAAACNCKQEHKRVILLERQRKHLYDMVHIIRACTNCDTQKWPENQSSQDSDPWWKRSWSYSYQAYSYHQQAVKDEFPEPYWDDPEPYWDVKRKPRASWQPKASWNKRWSSTDDTDAEPAVDTVRDFGDMEVDYSED